MTARPVGWSASLIRNLLRFVDMLPFGYFLGAVGSCSTPISNDSATSPPVALVICREHPLPRPNVPAAAALRLPLPWTSASNAPSLALPNARVSWPAG